MFTQRMDTDSREDEYLQPLFHVECLFHKLIFNYQANDRYKMIDSKTTARLPNTADIFSANHHSTKAYSYKSDVVLGEISRRLCSLRCSSLRRCRCRKLHFIQGTVRENRGQCRRRLSSPTGAHASICACHRDLPFITSPSYPRRNRYKLYDSELGEPQFCIGQHSLIWHGYHNVVHCYRKGPGLHSATRSAV